MLGRGLIARERIIGPVRQLAMEELGALGESRKQPAALRFRDSHHRLAWMFAAGLTVTEVAAKAGYSLGRVSLLHNDPAFQQLIAEKRKMVELHRAEVVDDFEDLIKSNMLKAERQLADKLDDADEKDETLPTRDLIAISRDAADRTGYGKKSTQVNVNVELASRLDKAIERSKSVRMVDVTPSPSLVAPAPPVPSGSAASPREPALVSSGGSTSHRRL